MSKTMSLKFKIAGRAPGFPKSASNETFLRQPRQFKVVGCASRPAPMAKADDGKLRPANP
jgi:hypothetical protein